MERAVCQMVRRRQDERLLQLPGCASDDAAPRTRRPSSGKGEPGEQRTLTYQQLHREVCKFANVLKKLGLKQGDVATIYMPMVPELAIAMLACARIGVVHSVVFGGFSAEAIADRNNDAKAKVVITADGGWRRGQAAAAESRRSMRPWPSRRPCKQCVVYQRADNKPAMQAGRDHWWHELMAQGVRRLPRRAARQRNAALHPLHQRLDRQAQGDPAHDGGLQPVRQEDLPVGLRLSRRGHLSGVRPIAAGSRGTATSSMARSRPGRRR